MAESTTEEDRTVMDDTRTPQPRGSDARPGDCGPEGEARNPESPDAPPCADHPITARIEALLLSTDRPMSDGKIAELLAIGLEEGGTAAIRAAIEELNQHYEQTGRSFRVESVAGGRQILTLPAFGPVLHRLHRDRMQTRLTPAAMETLSIVAYRQPILRAEIEAIRGVASGEVLRGLMERRLLKIVGRAEELGRPMLYGTTREFLRVFGLASLDDLPAARELRQPARKKPKGESAPVEPEDNAERNEFEDQGSAGAT